MIPQALAQAAKSPWTYAALFLTLAALAGGFACQTSRTPGIPAQERPPAPTPDQARPPISTPDMINYTNVEDADEVVDLGPPTVEIIREQVGRMSKARAEYLTAEPGRAIYLHSADQVIHLPPDVHVKQTIVLGSCADPYRCPITPAHILSRGDATMLIDDEGTIFPGNLETDDIGAFPFLAGQKIKELSRK